MKRDDEIVEKHPSYATILIHRTHGGGRRRLFGSPGAQIPVPAEEDPDVQPQA